MRGLNNDARKLDPSNLRRSLLPFIMGILENKFKDDSFRVFLDYMGPEWNHAHNNDSGSKGRILVQLDKLMWQM